MSAGFDPLRDEGEAYAARLREAGVRVIARCEGRLIHGFVNMGGAVEAADQALGRIAADLRSCFC